MRKLPVIRWGPVAEAFEEATAAKREERAIEDC
jgi:hypothetical protein